MQEKKAMLTIITPAYNRCELLKRCYTSLKKQTCKDFQWLIVDDGSTDNTKAVAETFLEEKNDFEITYVYKENGGKHTALNESHKYINGEFVFILDSDDYMVDDAVEQIKTAWSKFADNQDVGTVIFLKGFDVNKPICIGEKELEPVNLLKAKRIGSAGRDCCDVYRSELFKKYPFPVFEGEKFIGEGSAFFNIEKEKLGVYVNTVIYICDYNEDGLTKAGRSMRVKNPNGGRYNSKVYMDSTLPMKTRIKKGILYSSYSFFAGVPVKKIFGECKYKILTLVTFVPGWCLYLYWKIRHN